MYACGDREGKMEILCRYRARWRAQGHQQAFLFRQAAWAATNNYNSLTDTIREERQARNLGAVRGGRRRVPGRDDESNYPVAVGRVPCRRQ